MNPRLRRKILTHVTFDPDSDCWLWTRSTTENGYGRIAHMVGDTRVTQRVHIAAYEEWVEPVPRTKTGRRMDLDHECHNNDPSCAGGVTCRHRRCCNPAHLKPKTRRENLEASAKSRSSIFAARTHCPRNHRYPTTSVPGASRKCPRCHSWKESARQWNQRHPDDLRSLIPPTLETPEP